jgi:sugar phosphate isomerase/epimerase
VIAAVTDGTTRLGIGSYAFTWAIGVPGHEPGDPLGARGLVDRAAALGVALAQIDDNIALETWSDGELDALAMHARERGVALEVGTRGIEPERLRAFVGIARRLGSPLVRVVLDRGEARPTPDQAITTLRAAIGDYERAGITLAIENHDRFPAAVLAGIVRGVGSPRLGICLDTVNSLGAAEGPAVVVAALAPLAVNLHIKDFRVERAWHHLGFAVSGCPAGAGQLDVPWLLRELTAAGFRGNAILELWTPPGATLAESIATEAEWACESVRYLRRLIPA